MTYIILLIITYFIFIILLIYGLNRCQKTEQCIQSEFPDITIIIPFRNEEDNIGNLLRSISLLNYPKEKLEIITINDGSTDNSLSEIEANRDLLFPAVLKVIDLPATTKPSFGKKSAIRYGIQSATAEWVVTTDADCVVCPDWLSALVSYLSPQTMMVCGPVKYLSLGSVWTEVLQLEFFSLVAVGAASIGLRMPSFCNAANMMFRKKAFWEACDKYGKSYASGDDVFLLQSLSAIYGSRSISFANTTSALVHTLPPYNIQSLLSQRLRWASKTPGYKSIFAIFQGIFVYIYSLSIVVFIILSVVDNIFLLFAIALIIWKILLDYIFFKYAISRIIHMTLNFWIFLLTSILYPFYIVSIATLSFITKGVWKGRKV